MLLKSLSKALDTLSMLSALGAHPATSNCDLNPQSEINQAGQAHQKNAIKPKKHQEKLN